MSKTNCVNCGAEKQVTDLQCPFCGTRYADLTIFNPMSGDPIYIQLNNKNGKPITAKAYITLSELIFEPQICEVRDMSGMLKRLNGGTQVRGSIDFVLYESI